MHVCLCVYVCMCVSCYCKERYVDQRFYTTKTKIMKLKIIYKNKTQQPALKPKLTSLRSDGFNKHPKDGEKPTLILSL